MAHDRVISMEAFILDQLPVEPDIICDAWLDAHFKYPHPDNPLTRGLFPVAGPSHPPACSSTSPSATSISPESATAFLTPPKRPRLFPDAAADISGVLDDSNISRSSGGPCLWRFAPGGLIDLPSGAVTSAAGGVNPSHGSVSEFAPCAPPDAVERTTPATATVNQTIAGCINDTTGGSVGGPAEEVPDGSWDSSVRSIFSTNIFSTSDGDNITMPPPRNKRKAKSLSPTKGSKASSDTREKRKRLSHFHPPGSFGIPDLANHEPEDASLIPEEVIEILAVTFSVGYFEMACFPMTPEIEDLLAKSFRHETIPPHARLAVSTDAARDARELVEYAIDIHRACLQNSRRDEDEAAWYPLVRSLLSVEPPPPKSSASLSLITRPPRHTFSRSNTQDLFLAIDATTKSTTSDLAPNVTIKLDALLAFNPEHSTCAPVIAAAATASIPLNAFTDPTIRESIVVLGVEVKSAGGVGGEMEAEYQVGVWGMKTLNLTRSLGATTGKCNLALSVSVCGHIWSLHVTYWRGAGLVTHGPLCIGATDSLYGTMKIVAFVRRFKEWARDELWPDWEELLSRTLVAKTAEDA